MWGIFHFFRASRSKIRLETFLLKSLSGNTQCYHSSAKEKGVFGLFGVLEDFVFNPQIDTHFYWNICSAPWKIWCINLPYLAQILKNVIVSQHKLSGELFYIIRHLKNHFQFWQDTDTNNKWRIAGFSLIFNFSDLPITHIPN